MTAPYVRPDYPHSATTAKIIAAAKAVQRALGPGVAALKISPLSATPFYSTIVLSSSTPPASLSSPPASIPKLLTDCGGVCTHSTKVADC